MPVSCSAHTTLPYRSVAKRQRLGTALPVAREGRDFALRCVSGATLKPTAAQGGRRVPAVLGTLVPILHLEQGSKAAALAPEHQRPCPMLHYYSSSV